MQKNELESVISFPPHSIHYKNLILRLCTNVTKVLMLKKF